MVARRGPCDFGQGDGDLYSMMVVDFTLTFHEGG